MRSKSLAFKLSGLVVFAVILGIGVYLITPALTPSQIETTSDIALGRTIATTYCADCHSVGLTGESPHEIAPPFREIYLRYDVTLLSEALVEGFFTHPDMPEFEFDAHQANAIIAYLQSLPSQ